MGKSESAKEEITTSVEAMFRGQISVFSAVGPADKTHLEFA